VKDHLAAMVLMTAFMLEAANYNPWVSAAQGYLSHFLALTAINAQLLDLERTPPHGSQGPIREPVTSPLQPCHDPSLA
jgi:hypothetical protein